MRIWQTVVLGVSLFLSFNQANAQFTDINPPIANNLPGTNSINNIIANFPQLVLAVESGNDVRAIVHFDNCEVIGPELSTKIMTRLEGATTRFSFTQYIHAQEAVNEALIDTVSTSMNIFVQNSAGELMTLSGRLSVFEDNTATLHMVFFDPILHTQKFAVEWSCDISNGEDNNGVVLFNFS